MFWSETLSELFDRKHVICSFWKNVASGILFLCCHGCPQLKDEIERIYHANQLLHMAVTSPKYSGYPLQSPAFCPVLQGFERSSWYECKPILMQPSLLHIWRQISDDVILCGTISRQLFAGNPVKMSADCKVIEEVITNSSLSTSLREGSWALHFRSDPMMEYLRSEFALPLKTTKKLCLTLQFRQSYMHSVCNQVLNERRLTKV